MTDKHIEEIEELAALFSLGALPAEDAARFEKRLGAGCALCNSELEESRKVVHALPLSAPELAPPARLKARLMESIAERPAAKPPISEGLIVRANDTAWVDGPMPGVQTRSLLGKRTVLMRLAPKTFVPEHDHPASEQCLVLEGSVTSDGVTAYAGDFTYMPKGTHHTPLYSEDGCLLLIAYT
jgi:quercetin dioxygenase-like cupin family protein